MKIFFCAFTGFLLRYQGAAQPPNIPVGTVFPIDKTPVHDPVMIKEKDTYYLFCTGFGISAFSSKDMKTWRTESPVCDQPPASKDTFGHRILVFIETAIISITLFLLSGKILLVLEWQRIKRLIRARQILNGLIMAK